MKSTLISGANGFLGKYLVDSHMRRNVTVCELHRKQPDGVDNDFVVCDLANSVPVISPGSVARVIHTAGLAHDTKGDNYTPEDYFNTNVEGTKNLLKGLELASISVEHFVFISSVSVYGLETGEAISETSELAGLSPYALSKIEAEKLLIQWASKHDIPLLILRLPLVVGANPKGNMRKLQWLSSLGINVRLVPDRARRNLVHAGDVAEYLSTSFNGEGIYNLTDGHSYSFGEIYGFMNSAEESKFSLYVPILILQFAAKVGDFLKRFNLGFPLNSRSMTKITSTLTFDSNAAFENLDWKPENLFERCK